MKTRAKCCFELRRWFQLSTKYYNTSNLNKVPVKFKGSRTCLPLGESWRHPFSISRTTMSKALYFIFSYYCKSISSNCVLLCCFPIVQCHYSFLHFYIFKPGYYMLAPLTRSMFLCPCCLVFVVVQFKDHVKRLELLKIRCYIKCPLLLLWTL